MSGPAARDTRWMVFALLLTAALTAGDTAIRGQSVPEEAREERREAWQKVPEILAALDATPGRVIADVGAGGGFFTVRLARAVAPGGRVLAVDVNPGVVEGLRERAGREGLENVEVIAGAADDPRLPAGSLDGALIVNAYHEMDQHAAMLARLREALKPGGRLVIVEPLSRARADASRAVQVQHHEIGIEYVIADLEAAGFSIVEREDVFLERPADERADVDWLLVAH